MRLPTGINIKIQSLSALIKQVSFTEWKGEIVNCGIYSGEVWYGPAGSDAEPCHRARRE